jgi:nucleoside-diphosphate-sugar epimerase
MRTVVTGGGGFLGRRIAQLLLARGDHVTVIARQCYPDLERLGAICVQADVRDAVALQSTLSGSDVVFHVAAKTGHWGPRAAFQSVNVDGTESVLAAVRSVDVPALVYTSTPSVIGYSHDVENGGPDTPYAGKLWSAYAESKMKGEQLVLAANSDNLATIALRPHLIFGPGDKFLSRIARLAAQGRLRIIGSGQNRIDLTYVDNAAWAHLDAADALHARTATCAGKAYFISNGEPVKAWEWLNQILVELRLPPASRPLSLRSAHIVALLAESLWRILSLDGEPPITRFLAAAVARSHWFDMEPARRDLGYHVRVHMTDATRITLQWLSRELLGKGPKEPSRETVQTAASAAE